MDPRADGKVYPEVPFTVEPERVVAFREVFGQAWGVPPTFATAAEFTVLPTIVADPLVDLDFTHVIHGSQEYVYERSLVEGERLTIRSRIASIRVRRSTGFLTVEMELVDDAGGTVATARSTMVERVPDG